MANDSVKKREFNLEDKPGCSQDRLGLTLIEVLIATTITLLMMLALAKGFQALSNTVSEGRSHLNLSDKLRGMNELLRSDLRGITTDGSTPQSALLPAGYIKYYDGPISDSTATLFNQLPTATEVENRLSASRWGDIDDILMFTAKAGQGQVFRGKVPHALLVLNQYKKTGTLPPQWNNDPFNVNAWDRAWKTDVTISSEEAEIVWFMMPLNELNTIDPSKPDNMVFDVIPGVDRTGDGVADPDGMPDRIALCRRVLLIRPDLDISLPENLINNFFGSGSMTNRYVWMQPLAPDTSNPTTIRNTFSFMMQYPYQRCDLSVRPNLVSLSSGGNFVSVQTNSIERLHLPENRFAHYGFPVSGGTTLPSLALSTEFSNPNAASYIAMTDPLFSSFVLPAATMTGAPTVPTFRDRGFLPSCFMRTKPVLDAAGAITSIVPLLEEIVSADVVAFDVKGFDTSVKQLAHPGSDGQWGVALFDDVLGVPDSGTHSLITDFPEANWPGSDDLSLTPSDPGFALQLFDIAQATTAPAISGSGAFVDVGWGGKVFNSNVQRSVAPFRFSDLSAVQVARIANFFPSNLSVLDKAGVTLLPAVSLKEAGAHYTDRTLHQVYQPSFDTYTTAYDFDGEELLGRDASRNIPVGLVWQEGRRRLGFAATTGAADPVFPLTDTKPPVSGRLPSIQATIRVQDFTAGNLQQISVVHDLNN